MTKLIKAGKGRKPRRISKWSCFDPKDKIAQIMDNLTAEEKQISGDGGFLNPIAENDLLTSIVKKIQTEGDTYESEGQQFKHLEMWSPSKREDSGKIYHLWKTALSLFKNAKHYCYGYDKMDNYCMIEVPGKSYVEFAKLSVPHDPVEGKKLPKNHPAINMMSSWLALTAPRYFGLSILMKDKTPAGQTSEYREGFFLPLFQNDPRIPERYRNSEIPEKYRNEFGHIYLVRSTPKKNMFKYYTHADSKQGLEAQLDAAINLYSMGKRVT